MRGAQARGQRQGFVFREEGRRKTDVNLQDLQRGTEARKSSSAHPGPILPPQGTGDFQRHIFRCHSGGGCAADS